MLSETSYLIKQNTAQRHEPAQMVQHFDSCQRRNVAVDNDLQQKLVGFGLTFLLLCRQCYFLIIETVCTEYCICHLGVLLITHAFFDWLGDDLAEIFGHRLDPFNSKEWMILQLVELGPRPDKLNANSIYCELNAKFRFS